MKFQYSLIVNISLIDWYLTYDFSNVDGHEWKEQGLLTGFLKKFPFEKMGPFWVQEWHILITLYPI